MRSRLALLISLVFVMAVVAAPIATAAPTTDLIQAQGTDSESETQSDEEGADAETGAGEEEQGPAAETEEEGPQWTYQMSKITLVMLLLLFLAMGALYYRMIARRQRGA